MPSQFSGDTHRLQVPHNYRAVDTSGSEVVALTVEPQHRRMAGSYRARYAFRIILKQVVVRKKEIHDFLSRAPVGAARVGRGTCLVGLVDERQARASAKEQRQRGTGQGCKLKLCHGRESANPAARRYARLSCAKTLAQRIRFSDPCDWNSTAGRPSLTIFAGSALHFRLVTLPWNRYRNIHLAIKTSHCEDGELKVGVWTAFLCA